MPSAIRFWQQWQSITRKFGLVYPNQLGFEQAADIAKASKLGMWSQSNWHSRD
ncbi:hypothetical protein [uncultured Nostoc sp.]|uniref:hypothetical protein n=1 Tax=uncultured Nostoc sp. TaxID=340711 RepID=UPI0035CA6D77